MSREEGRNVAIIQARMGSSRLPNKVLLPLAGQALLFHIVERLKQVPSLDQIVVATTASDSDRAIVDYCNQKGIEVFSYTGDHDDLLGRYIECGEHYSADVIVMVCGDCPLFDVDGVDHRIQLLKQRPEVELAKYSTPTIEGGVAVLRLATFKKISQRVKDKAHHEHALLYLMENPNEFIVDGVEAKEGYRDIKHRLWLDTPADYVFLEKLYQRLYRKGEVIGLDQVVELLKTDKRICAINAHVTQKQVRSRGYAVCLNVKELDEALHGRAAKTARSLIEQYNIGLRVNAKGMGGEQKKLWLEHQIHCDSELAKTTEAVVYMVGDADFIPLKPGLGGEPRVRFGLGQQQQIETNIGLLVAYLGQYAGEGSHFIPTLHSSNDGSHLYDSDCPICGGNQRQVLWRHDSGITNVMCNDCGHVYLAKRPAPEVIKASYSDFGQSYDDDYLLDQGNSIFALADSRQRYLNSLLPERVESVLELGCGYGHFLSRFPDSIRRVGIEPSADQAGFARKQFGIIELWQCGYESLSHRPPSWPEKGFDLICSFHVLEHMEQPRNFLKFIKKNIKPGGYLCLAVPNLMTLPPDLNEIFFITRGLHLHTFSPQVLENIFLSEGFEVVDIRSEQKSVMSPSSMIAVVRLSGQENNESKPLHRQKIIAAGKRFHDCLELNLSRLRKILTEWCRQKKQVFIYGGGVHTRALVELAGIENHQIIGVVDDDPDKQGNRIQGIDIVDYQTAVSLGADIFLVSSSASEGRILERLGKELPNGVQVVGLYRDIFALEGGQPDV